MFKNFVLTFLLFLSSFIVIYPSKKENTNLTDYCFSFEKILSRNSLEKRNNLSKRYKTYAKDIILFGTNKTKGDLAQSMIDQYKSSKQSFFITFMPNEFYCLTGYWIEKVNPGTFESIFYEKSKQRIDQYKNIKKEVDVLIKDINSEYRSIKKEIENFLEN